MMVEQQCKHASDTVLDNAEEIFRTLESGDSTTIIKMIRTGKLSPVQPFGSDNLTLLHYICQFGEVDILKDIASTHPECIVQTVLCQYSLLHCACRHSQLNIVQYLIDNGLYNEDVLTIDGASSPIHLAVVAGHIGTMAFLIEHSPCNPMLVDEDGDHLIHTACLHGHLEIVKYLIKNDDYDESIVNCYTQQTPLHVAAKKGHLDIVQYLVEEGNSDPSCADDVGRTPLYLAVWYGRINTVKYLVLLSKGELLTTTTREYVSSDGVVVGAGKTPLHAACLCGHFDVVQYLVDECHCDISCSDTIGSIPLHSASAGGNLVIVKYLILECQCDPMSVQCNEQFRWVPLHFAASNGHLPIVKYLIEEHNCNPMYYSKKGFAPIHLATQNGHFDILKYLIEECHCEPMTRLFDQKFQQVLLHFAASKGHLPITKYFIEEHGCDPMYYAKNGVASLHLASQNGHINVVKYLIEECQCDPMSTMRDEQLQQVPLHFTAMKGHLTITKYLVEKHGCDPMCYSKEGTAPLHFASKNGHISTVKYLIEECQCDPMSRMCDKQFQQVPLHFAALNGHLLIIKLLIEKYGCNPMCYSKEGFAPLHCAAQSGHFDIVKYLIDECQCDSMSRMCDEWFQWVPLHFASVIGHLVVTKYLIEEHDCDPMCYSKTGHAPLHLAARHSHVEIVKYLIEECQCDPMSRVCDDFELAILHFAAIQGHLMLVKYLIDEQYCNPICYTNNGFTPLHLAAENGHFDVLKYLIEKCQCDSMSRMCDEQFQLAPLHFAAKKGHLLIAKYLIEEQNCNPMCYTKDAWFTPLLLASGCGHLDVVKYLIEECQCDPMSMQCNEELQLVPLHIAAMTGHLSIAKYLIEDHGCDPMYRSKKGHAPLHLATENGHIDIVKYLIEECRCDPMSKMCDKQFEWIPLHFAASKGYISIAKYLIEKHGCDPMYQTRTGFTSVLLASENSHFDIVKYFIEECHCDPMSRIYNEHFYSLPRSEPKHFLGMMVAKRLTETGSPNVSAHMMALMSEIVDQRVLSAELEVGGMAYLKEKNKLGGIEASYSGDTESLYKEYSLPHLLKVKLHGSPGSTDTLKICRSLSKLEGIHSVDVVAETSFEVTNESLDFQWQSYGLMLHFPQDSLPPDCKSCILEIKATISGSSELPEGCEIVSGIYWIYCPIHFSKPVTMKLQYDGTGTEGLSFVRAACTQKQLPHRFRRIEGGLFPSDSPYCSLSVSQFSGWGIISRLRSRPRRYTAEVHYCSASRNLWTVLFVITCKRNLDLDHTAFRKALEEYTLAGREISDHGPHFPVVFSERSIRLDVPSSACSGGWELKDGWNLKCLSCPEISKSDVDSCKHPRRDHIPHIKLIISCDARTVTTVSSLVQRLSLIGEKDSSYFLLTCESTCPHVHPTTPESSSLEECLSRAGIAVDCAVLDQVITRSEHIADIAKQFTEWKDLFPYFGLERHKQDEIEESGHLSEQRRKMLLMWIQKYGPRATYRNLCTLLLKQHRTDVVDAVCTAVQEII